MLTWAALPEPPTRLACTTSDRSRPPSLPVAAAPPRPPTSGVRHCDARSKNAPPTTGRPSVAASFAPSPLSDAAVGTPAAAAMAAAMVSLKNRIQTIAYSTSVGDHTRIPFVLSCILGRSCMARRNWGKDLTFTCAPASGPEHGGRGPFAPTTKHQTRIATSFQCISSLTSCHPRRRGAKRRHLLPPDPPRASHAAAEVHQKRQERRRPLPHHAGGNVPRRLPRRPDLAPELGVDVAKLLLYFRPPPSLRGVGVYPSPPFEKKKRKADRERHPEQRSLECFVVPCFVAVFVAVFGVVRGLPLRPWCWFARGSFGVVVIVAGDILQLPLLLRSGVAVIILCRSGLFRHVGNSTNKAPFKRGA